eukprot:8248137-Ditylum_brightwellii.AAC.1
MTRKSSSTLVPLQSKVNLAMNTQNTDSWATFHNSKCDQMSLSEGDNAFKSKRDACFNLGRSSANECSSSCMIPKQLASRGEEYLMSKKSQWNNKEEDYFDSSSHKEKQTHNLESNIGPSNAANGLDSDEGMHTDDKNEMQLEADISAVENDLNGKTTEEKKTVSNTDKKEKQMIEVKDCSQHNENNKAESINSMKLTTKGGLENHIEGYKGNHIIETTAKLDSEIMNDTTNAINVITSYHCQNEGDECHKNDVEPI